MTEASDMRLWVPWHQGCRRLAARAVRGLMSVVGSSTRARGLALGALIERHMAPGVLCIVPFPDHILLVDPRDDKIALKLLSGRPWQRRELDTAIAALRSVGSLRPGGLFVDVGANIGTQTIYAMRSGVFSGALAIEPDPHNRAILRRNLDLNGLADRVVTIAAAASACPGVMLLARHRQNHGAHSVEPGALRHPAGTLPVSAISIDGLLAERAITPEQVSLVKIDVEGHETAVLAGMTRLGRAGVPVMVELTAARAEVERLAAFKAVLAPNYGRVLDLGRGRDSQALRDLAWSAPQSDLLVY